MIETIRACVTETKALLGNLDKLLGKSKELSDLFQAETLVELTKLKDRAAKVLSQVKKAGNHGDEGPNLFGSQGQTEE